MKHLIALLTALGAGAALAAGGDVGETAKQSTNWTAIIMFGTFVLATLWITKWAASKTRSAADFYTAGGGISGTSPKRRRARLCSTRRCGGGRWPVGDPTRRRPRPGEN